MTEKSHDQDVAFIRALAELLNANDLTELQVKREYGEDNALNVLVSRMQSAAPVAAPVAVAAPAAAPAPAPAASPAPAAPQPAEDPADHAGAVPSPMVGTVYLAAEPGAEPFVKVGDTVEEGATLCIVEAMKTMNHIPAPHSGTVKRILIEDGTAVEFGSLLMIVA